MAIPDTRDGLESVDYQYSGSSTCRRCGTEIQWFVTPKGKRMPMSVVSGTENDDPERLEFHKCP